MHDVQPIVYLYVHIYLLFYISIYFILTLNLLGLSYVQLIPLYMSDCSSLPVICDNVSFVFRSIVS